MDAKEFGAFIAGERKAKGLTQKQLADTLKVTDKAVSRWENGHGYPDIETLEDLSDALGLSLMELMHSKRPSARTAILLAMPALDGSEWVYEFGGYYLK